MKLNKEFFAIWRDSESLHPKLISEKKVTLGFIPARQIPNPWTIIKPDKQCRIFPERQVGSKQQTSPCTLGQLNGFMENLGDTWIMA